MAERFAREGISESDGVGVIFHRCDIYNGATRSQLRVVFYRHNVRPLVADYEFRILARAPGQQAYVLTDGTLEDFPRAAGVEGLAAHVVEQVSQIPDKALDENGQWIPFPTLSPEQLKRAGMQLLAQARTCFKEAGLLSPDFVDVPSINQLELFEQLTRK